jgi:hypothetical protein
VLQPVKCAPPLLLHLRSGALAVVPKIEERPRPDSPHGATQGLTNHGKECRGRAPRRRIATIVPCTERRNDLQKINE